MTSINLDPATVASKQQKLLFMIAGVLIIGIGILFFSFENS